MTIQHHHQTKHCQQIYGLLPSQELHGQFEFDVS